MKLIAASLLCAALALPSLGEPAPARAPRLSVRATMSPVFGLAEPRHAPPGFVDAVALSANGRRLAVAGATGQERGSVLLVCVRETTSGRLLAALRAHGPGYVTRLALSADGALVATGTSAATWLWSVARGRLLARVPGTCAALAFTGRRTLRVLGTDGTLYTWAGGRPRARVLRVGRLDQGWFLRDGRRVVTVRAHWRRNLADCFVGLLDTATGRPYRSSQVLSAARLEAFTAARSTGRVALFEWYDGNTVVADPPRWRTRAILYLETWAQGMALSPDGRVMAVGRRPGTVRLVDSLTGKQLCSARVGGEDVPAVCWSDDGRYLAAVGQKHDAPTVARVWRVLR